MPLANWGLSQGSEVCILALLVSASALMAIRCVQSENSALPLYLLLGASTLFRLDAAVPALIVIRDARTGRPAPAMAARYLGNPRSSAIRFSARRPSGASTTITTSFPTLTT